MLLVSKIWAFLVYPVIMTSGSGALNKGIASLRFALLRGVWPVDVYPVIMTRVGRAGKSKLLLFLVYSRRRGICYDFTD